MSERSMGCVNQEDVIKVNLRAFLPYIIHCVPATQLLAHLHYYNKGQRKEIFALSCQRPHQATEMALRVLMDTTEKQGQFTSLLDALDTAGYPKIVDILVGKNIPNDMYDEKILEHFTPAIIQQLNPIEILPYLIKYEVIGDEEKQNVRAEDMNHGPMKASFVLLSYLPSRKEDWFKYFIHALIDCGNNDLAEQLEPDLYTKIMAQRSAESEWSNPQNKSLTESHNSDIQEHVLSVESAGEIDLNTGNPRKENIQKGYSEENKGRSVLEFDELLGAEEASGDLIEKEDLEGNEKSGKNGGKYHKMQTTEANRNSELAAANKSKYSEVKPKQLIGKQALMYQDFHAKRNSEDEKFSEIRQTKGDSRVRNEAFNMSKLNFEEDLLEHIGKDKQRSRDIEASNKTLNIPSINFEEDLMGDLVEMKQRGDDIEVSIETGNNHNGKSEDESTDSLTEVKQLANDVAGSRQDGIRSYDRSFLLSLRHSKLANYVPPQILNHPDIVNISPENSADEREEPYGGARPKVPKMLNSTVNKSDNTNGLMGLTNDNAGQLMRADSHQMRDMVDLEDLDFQELLDDLRDGMNNLGTIETIYSRTESTESLDYNIPTDSDQIDGVEDKDVELRNYQKELAMDGIGGENVIIMAPTNSGKTRVSMKIIQEHLRRQKRDQQIASVIFLCQDETLAIQQARSFAEHLPAYRTKIISGSTQRDKKEYLKDFVDRRDVLVVTAQVLINSLENGEIRDLTRFTMMVFDECHHANKNHPYNQILSKYMDLKLVQNVNMDEMPQVVGMTASIGCGGNLDGKAALKHMKQVMANMDAMSLCTVRRYKDDLKKNINPPIEETIQVPRRKDNGFEVTVNQVIDSIDGLMVSHAQRTDAGVQNIVPPYRGNEQFHQWLAEFKKRVAKEKQETARLFNPCRLHLMAYNMCLMVYNDARISEAMMIVDRFMAQYALLREKDDTDNYLLELYQELKQQSFDHEPENPKLVKMQRIILDVLGRDENARGIVFVKTRQLARALVTWMNSTEELKQFKAELFVGQQAPAHQGGTTLSRQIDIMEYFRGGHHRILFATSVLEEGIDVSKCNLVMRYEHVTNEIVRLQSRGRARAADSKYIVLTEAGSRIAAKEEKNKLLEELMNRLVPILQAQIEGNQNEWEREMRAIQQEVKDKEILKKKEKEEAMTQRPVGIQCLNCQTEICRSSEIKIIQNAHHVIIGKEAADKFLFFSSPSPQFIDDELQYHGRIVCIECDHILGGICEYRHAQFPLLKIGTWRTDFGKTYKKWKEVAFYMEKFTLDDLREVVDRMDV